MKVRLFAVLPLGAMLLFAKASVSKRMEDATSAFKEIMAVPERTISQELLAKAECIIVVPDLVKGGLIFGAKYGRGFVSCRKKDHVGWSAPGAIRIEGGTFGLQIGGAWTDVFMLVMNQRGMERLLSNQFTMGADASAAAGPVGRSTQAETDALMTAEILTWSRARGLFGGVMFTGSTLREDSEWNMELYGKKITNKEIVNSDLEPPAAAADLLAELNRYSSRK
jgi:SH3 domain-containing YSC84-like protein 1